MTITGIHEFNRTIEKFQFATYKEFETMLRKLSLQLLTGIVKRTPVDTGRARGNWQLTIDTPASGVLRVEGAGQKAPTGKAGVGPAGADAIRTGLSIMKQLPNHGIGHIIYVTNNVEYIIKLEEGGDVGSKQAPKGMVAITLAELQQQFG